MLHCPPRLGSRAELAPTRFPRLALSTTTARVPGRAPPVQGPLPATAHALVRRARPHLLGSARDRRSRRRDLCSRARKPSVLLTPPMHHGNQERTRVKAEPNVQRNTPSTTARMLCPGPPAPSSRRIDKRAPAHGSSRTSRFSRPMTPQPHAARSHQPTAVWFDAPGPRPPSRVPRPLPPSPPPPCPPPAATTIDLPHPMHPHVMD